ncbi:MAG TPA: isoprenyl transferase [Kiloniellales bacterium]|nr:isoprenyl transferase [Kiloniellales bacterium]
MTALSTRPVPRHVAIIMDGNGRWATRRGLPRTAGHRQGAEAARQVVEAAIDLGIANLTLFSFSSENWKRPRTEVLDLMGLLRRYLQSEIAELHKNGVRLTIIGERARLPEDIQRLVTEGERQTAGNRRLRLIMALSYGARQELVLAARRLAEEVALGRLRPEEIDEPRFAGQLFCADVPDPDLVIRTSGEQRLSNFLLWQAAYSEFLFVDKLWPDFGKEDLAAAVAEYVQRDRRYGATASSG